MDPGSIATCGDERCLAKLSEVPRDRGLRRFEHGVDVAHAELAVGEQRENPHPKRLASGLEDLCERLSVLLRHVHDIRLSEYANIANGGHAPWREEWTDRASTGKSVEVSWADWDRFLESQVQVGFGRSRPRRMPNEFDFWPRESARFEPAGLTSEAANRPGLDVALGSVLAKYGVQPEPMKWSGWLYAYRTFWLDGGTDWDEQKASEIPEIGAISGSP